MNNFISPEDLKDFEQEKRIKEWLSSQSHEDRGIVLPYTSSKGTARNSRVRAAFSLDQKVCNDSETTFANFVAGSDGRDLWNERTKMTDLVIKQITFMKYLGLLLAQFPALSLSIGEAWRSDETCQLYAREGKGIPVSCHTLRLAIDLIVRKPDGTPSNDKVDYQALGDFWKGLPLNQAQAIPIETSWGGDFSDLCDFYHFSITHNGIR